jgi:hypothetical protein
MKIRAFTLDDVGGPVKVETVDLDAPAQAKFSSRWEPRAYATAINTRSRDNTPLTFHASSVMRERHPNAA